MADHSSFGALLEGDTSLQGVHNTESQDARDAIADLVRSKNQNSQKNHVGALLSELIPLRREFPRRNDKRIPTPHHIGNHSAWLMNF